MCVFRSRHFVRNVYSFVRFFYSSHIIGPYHYMSIWRNQLRIWTSPLWYWWILLRHYSIRYEIFRYDLRSRGPLSVKYFIGIITLYIGFVVIVLLLQTYFALGIHRNLADFVNPVIIMNLGPICVVNTSIRMFLGFM